MEAYFDRAKAFLFGLEFERWLYVVADGAVAFIALVGFFVIILKGFGIDGTPLFRWIGKGIFTLISLPFRLVKPILEGIFVVLKATIEGASAIIVFALKFLGLILKGFVALIGFLFSFDMDFSFFSFFKPKSDLHGTASFLKGFERWKLLRRGLKGVVVDGKRRLNAENSFKHIAVVAPTGGGKTSAFIIPNVLSLHNASAIVTDPSGEILQRTGVHLKAQGFDIKVLNVKDLEKSLCYNPLHRATDATEIQKIASVLIDTAFPDNNASTKFWNEGAKSVLQVLIQCLKNENPKFANLSNVRYLLNNFDSEGNGIEAFILRTAGNEILAEWNGLIANDEKVLMGMVSTAKTALNAFQDPNLCKLTATDTLNFETMRTQKTALFLNVPEHELKYYGFILNLLYVQFFDFAMKLPQKGETYLPIYAFLDEFGNLPKINDFSLLITTLRKRKVSCSLVFQSLAQLENAYGKADAETILDGGIQTKIFLSGLPHNSCLEIERALGKKTVTVSKGTKGYEQTTGRALLTADEIRTLDSNQALMIHGNKKPILLKIKPYFKSWRMKFKTRKVYKAPKQTTPISEIEYVDLA